MSRQKITDAELAQRCADFMFANDQASQALGIKVNEVGPGFAKLGMQVREDMLNGHKICHGGFIFSLADSAFAFACNSYNQITVAQGCSIEFIRPASLGDQLTAVAHEQSRGRVTGVYDIEITRADGKKIAIFRGKSFAVDQPLIADL